jgi:Asp-tRNA(Asn)/Glu-tRNA(Gln) amidotransferase A subunit family amidase
METTQMKAPSFSAARERFRAGAESPRDYLERCLQRIEERDPTVRAFVTTNPEGARRAADAATERYRAGKPLSPIDGMPIAIKDIIETEDMPTEFGSPVFAGWRGGRDAACVYALRQAGAIIVGKAVTTEFASAPPGPTRNPLDLDRTPGGSSSGSAAAVAAGMVPVALGTQVGGSVLRPASFCGIIGFKPTFGALNRGNLSDNYSQNCIGTLSVTLEDGWAVCHEISRIVGGDPGFSPFTGGATPAAPRRPEVLAVLETAGWAVADEGAKAALQAFLPRLSAAGVTLVDRQSSHRVAVLEEAIAEALEICNRIANWEGLWPFAELAGRSTEGLSAGLVARMATARTMTPDEYRMLLRRRDHMRDTLLTLAGDIDACITLAAPGVAPLGIASTGNAIFNLPASALRTPALSLPMLHVDNLPLGVQLIGFPQRDRDLSAVASFVLGLDSPT